MPRKWYDSTIVRIEDESPNTKRFWVNVNPEDEITFKAGQFVTMDLPIHEKRLKRWRSYSIANAPNHPDQLEFCIVHLEGGAATNYFFNEVKVGTPIKFKGPSGTFVLPENIDSDLVFICTGTGVAPFRSMIGDIQQQNKSHRNIHLIFGTRYQDGILYRAEFEKLVAELPTFKFEVALSREADLAAKAFPFPTYSGYLHQIYMEQYAEVRPDVHFYICGWSNMIDQAVEHLIKDLGYDPTQIHYELYG